MAKSMMDMLTSGGKPPKGKTVSAKKTISTGKSYPTNTNPVEKGFKATAMKSPSAGKMKKGDTRLS